MHDLLIRLVLAFSIALIHFAYIDFRFRYREGMGWFWMLKPAPPLMWVARATVAAVVVFALRLHFVGTTPIFFMILGGLVAAHFISLVLLEALEPR